MKPITFEKLRRLMGGGRKKKERSEAPFKRSDSFRRISIKRHYLERGHAKLPGQLLAAKSTTAVTVEENACSVAATSSVTSATKPIVPSEEDQSLKIGYGQWLRGMQSEEKSPKVASTRPVSPTRVEITRLDRSPVTSRQIRVSARPSPAVSIDNDLTPRQTRVSSRPSLAGSLDSDPASRQIIVSSRPSPAGSIDSDPASRQTRVSSRPSPASSVDSDLGSRQIRVSARPSPATSLDCDLRSPASSRQIRVSARPSPATSLDSDLPFSPTEISLGRIWMDPPVSRTPRSLELPPTASRRLIMSPNDVPGCSGVERAHRSLESALKDRAARRDDPLPRLPLPPPPVTRTQSGSSKTLSSRASDPHSSKDSGFSFSIPRLNVVTSGGGFFRKKMAKPKPSVSRDGYFKRTSSIRKSQERVLRRSNNNNKSKGRNSGRKANKKSITSNNSDIYQVMIGRPRSLRSLQLDPMFFVPPEKRKSHLKSIKRSKRYEVCEIRDLESVAYAATEATTSLAPRRHVGEHVSDDVVDEDDEGLYECVRGSRPTELDPVVEDLSSSGSEDERYVPQGVSPVPRRRPVRRKKSARIKFVAKPHAVRRAPSTLRRRKSTKKISSKSHPGITSAGFGEIKQN